MGFKVDLMVVIDEPGDSSLLPRFLILIIYESLVLAHGLFDICRIRPESFLGGPEIQPLVDFVPVP